MKFINSDGINIALRNVEGTPRIALYLYLSSDKEIPSIGAHQLLGNLLLQGTKDKTSEQIATELENLGIEVTIDSRVDFLKVSIVCLNEDLAHALDLVNDFMVNSTFDTFDKEIFKFKGETAALLDSPVRKASDIFYRKLFSEHKYGITNTKILENIENLKKEHITEHYKNLINGCKIVSVAGDIKSESELINMVKSKLDFMKSFGVIMKPVNYMQFKPELFKIAKSDAKQAQIFQGWLTEGINSKDCAALNVLNNILGASGLSSRLFSELRDKKGLAYTVRSTYKVLKDASCFVLYIGTEPSNIKKSLEGFKYEIERIIKEPPNKDEVIGGIENHIGKYKYFYTQTNSQIASNLGWCYITGLDFDYNERLLEDIKKVNQDDIVNVCKKYLLKEPVTVVLAPEEYLKF